MRLKRHQLHMKIVTADTLPLEQLPVKGEILLVMDFWDGGAKEGCLFVEKRNDGHILWEYVYPYGTHDADAYKWNLNSDNMIEQIEAFCKNCYTPETPFAFSQISQEELQTFLRK